MTDAAKPSAFTDLHPVDYLRVLYRRRRLIVLVVAIVVGAVAVYTAESPKVYEARATVLINADKPNVVPIPSVLNEGTMQDGYFATQIQLLTSRALAKRTVTALKLTSRAEFGITDETAAVDAVLDGLRVVPIRGSRMVSVGVRSWDPGLAADIANTHAREYVEQSLDNQLHASKEANEWLNLQLSEEKARVERAESALQAYREQHDAVSLASPGQDIVVQKLADLNAAVTRAKTARIEREASYQELLKLQRSGTAVEAFPAILTNPFVQQLKGELARLQREYSEMSETLGERHPTLQAKRTEVETTTARLEAEVTRVVESERRAYESALAEETSLVKALDDQKQEALSLNRRAIEYAALDREAQSVRLVYQNLLQRAKETSVASDMRFTNIRIVDAARRPQSPVLPRPLLNLSAGLISGLLLAVALVFGFEYVDDRARTPDDIRMAVKLPVLGLLPEFKRNRRNRKGLAPLLQPGVEPALVESVRTIRTSIVTSVDERRPRSIVVTSAQSGEGKTFVASSLAIALAQAKQRVLLIDADMRRPSAHRLFDLPLDPGLSGVLAEDVPLADVLQPTAVPGLTVMSGGNPTDHAPELLGSATFESLLTTLQQHYSWVIIDSPPVLSVTDPALLGRIATGVVFVVASGSTSARAARLAVDELQAAGATVIGAALTRAPLRQHPLYFSPYARGQYPGAPAVRVDPGRIT
jgi:capsular exopolysaccharide synthesis family protein